MFTPYLQDVFILSRAEKSFLEKTKFCTKIRSRFKFSVYYVNETN